MHPLLEKGTIAANLGNKKEAEDCFRQVLEQDPRNIAALLMLADVLENPLEKREVLHQVQQIDPENRGARMRLNRLEPRPMLSPTPPVPPATQAARSHHPAPPIEIVPPKPPANPKRIWLWVGGGLGTLVALALLIWGASLLGQRSPEKLPATGSASSSSSDSAGMKLSAAEVLRGEAARIYFPATYQPSEGMEPVAVRMVVENTGQKVALSPANLCGTMWFDGYSSLARVAFRGNRFYNLVLLPGVRLKAMTALTEAPAGKIPQSLSLYPVEKPVSDATLSCEELTIKSGAGEWALSLKEPLPEVKVPFGLLPTGVPTSQNGRLEYQVAGRYHVLLQNFQFIVTKDLRQPDVISTQLWVNYEVSNLSSTQGLEFSTEDSLMLVGVDSNGQYIEETINLPLIPPGNTSIGVLPVDYISGPDGTFTSEWFYLALVTGLNGEPVEQITFNIPAKYQRSGP
ncbi:MAG TPA: hypothetical protein PKW33_02080 [Anaerolineaceae bacterium]|nr:hypothetical protein [Anaerolineaceae bacterium]HPN50348.1 hypothetical protein [Anaerolineaceae bacterium]